MSEFYFTIKIPGQPGRLLHGHNLLDFCPGVAGEESILENWLNKWSEKKLPAPAVAVGFVRYDGSFWFGIPRLTLLVSEQVYQSEIFENFKTAKFFDIRTKNRKKNQLLHPQNSASHISSSLDRDQYIRAVLSAQRFIRSGDIYQINICRILSGRWHGDADTLARQVYRITRAPCFSHIHLPDADIISASPELFLDISGNTITTQPIKGTRSRSPNPRTDARLGRELTTCPKELAELIMITDLERNDLGKICCYGSVKVTELATQKIFPHVRHLVSTITGRLRADVSPLQALFSCLPGGSITGAPKIRATQIISQLEPVPRGLYCGVIGFFDLRKKHARFSIAIRTIELRRESFCYGVGSGITADSIPSQEWEETIWKSAPLVDALRIQPEVSVSIANGSNN